jgi:beta-N-acetylhexosaminidase
VIAATCLRVASYSGRMDLSPAQAALLEDLASDTARPLLTVGFGNPYVAALAAKLPTMLLSYDFGDASEAAAVRALCGESAIGGKLPISIPGLFAFGHGLERAATRPAAGEPRNP